MFYYKKYKRSFIHKINGQVIDPKFIINCFVGHHSQKRIGMIQIIYIRGKIKTKNRKYNFLPSKIHFYRLNIFIFS